ncbi:MAG: hypothetical protein DI536_21575 [Archangium gephyra]|uniref:TPM domain-containing protein n=1 Tax=Archangium gephyra TaxID=48 RepID=A0A2W5T1L7_9BACT|nr:MAG: hypothetical protein DI536_21575 [Archangium gephyra]
MVMAGWLVVVLAAATDIAPPASGSWVVDRTGQLSAETKQQVDALANELNDAGVAKLAVLVTGTVEDTPRAYARGVLAHWQLGSDGVLVMIAVDSRKAEIVFGSGRPLTEHQTDVVMERDLVANLKAGALNAAVLDSARALHDALLVPPPPPRPPTFADKLADALLLAITLAIFPGGFLALLFVLLTRRYWRRRCTKCRTQRRRLSEAEEDEHLTAEQQREEQARLADYDVWWCSQCSDAIVTKWAGAVSSVKNCPLCRADSTVLTPASQHRPTEGNMKLTEKCLRCSYTHSWVAFIPANAVTSLDASDSSFDSGGSSSDGGGSSGSW